MGCGVAVLTGTIRLDFVEETGSTNSDLLARAGMGEAISDGAWLIAARQTAGRGRLGRAWDSRTGNFHGSTLVPLRADDPPAPTLALVAAVALHDAVVDISRGLVRPQIKWPNDLLVGDGKLAGILLERQGDVVVVGIGCNIQYAPDVPGRETVALAQLGCPIAVNQFADALARCFSDTLADWRQQGLAAMIARWLACAHPKGTRLTVSDGAQAGLTGGFDGLEQDGSLRLALDSGGTVIVNAGEVRLADD